MKITDPIADLLTRIRNAFSAGHISVSIPSSKMKMSILQILCDEGFIRKFIRAEDGKQGMLKVFLKYNPDKSSVIKNLKRISKPGSRVYRKYTDLPKVVGGLGISIVSTSKGLMTDHQARSSKLGGEVLAYIW